MRNRWSLKMDEYSHSTLCDGCSYLYMLISKLIPVNKKGSLVTRMHDDEYVS